VITVAFPCWNRAALLVNTLKSIARQNYPVELIVVESGNDGQTETVASDFGAKYFREERDEYPAFQNIAKLWNRCWQAATNEIVILQCAEVLHESENVIVDLVASVESGNKILATPLIKDLAQDGSFAGWYNHPREGSRPGWVSGAGPHAFRKSEMEKIGGYEELFYGYGQEDNFWFHILRKNGWTIEYVESAVCAHQWHERPKFEPTTGYANLSLIHILTMEIEDGTREPIANKQPLVVHKSPTVEEVCSVLSDCTKLPMSKTFREWEYKRDGMHVDDLFVYQRNIANEKLGDVSEIGEMITESAWAVLREAECRKVAALAYGTWAQRATRCADIHATWAAMSLEKARRLIGEYRA
jgi:glycosyltransferase involved in cell wall biosynthesis